MWYRRKTYILREEVTENGTIYHISFRDGQGKFQELCVPYDFYMAFHRLELDNRRLENWDWRHREFSEIYDETLNRRAYYTFFLLIYHKAIFNCIFFTFWRD